MPNLSDQAIWSSERLGRIVEDATSEVFLFSADDYRFVLVNRGARTNLGYRMADLADLTPWDIKPDLTRDQFVTLVAPLKSGEVGHLDFETRHQRKDGTHYDVAVRLQLVDIDGSPVFFAAIQDVTEHRQAQRALNEASRRLDAIINNTRMAIFMMDHRQQCVFMNQAAEALTGYSTADMAGRTLHDVIHHTRPDGSPFPPHECPIDRAFPENNQVEGEEVFVHRDGHFYPVAFTASPVRDQHGKTIGTVIEARDITEERQVRETMAAFHTTLQQRVEAAVAERKAMEAQVFQAQKMEAVGKLTGGIAHDFNNLLQVIAGNLELLQRDVAGNPRAEKRIGHALTGVERGSKLASQLLAFGRRQPLAPRVLNLGKLVREMDDMFRRALGEAVEIETIVTGGLWNCEVDPVQFENALLNLVINARDAMDGRGLLTIELGNAALDDHYAALHPDVRAGQYVMLAVTDTGAGIPADIIDQVFEPFFTTKPEGKGTGLGLSMIYGFVKQSGGHVKIYSEVGEGTTIRLYLPRSRGVEQAPLASATNVLVGGSETILLVEDDAHVRTTVGDMLTDLGYHVLQSRDADSALAVLQSGVAIDMLFTDVVMPGQLRSPDLARHARELIPGIAVLFTSGYTQNSIVHEGRLDEGVELLSKPYGRDELAAKIRAVLARREPAGD